MSKATGTFTESQEFICYKNTVAQTYRMNQHSNVMHLQDNETLSKYVFTATWQELYVVIFSNNQFTSTYFPSSENQAYTYSLTCSGNMCGQRTLLSQWFSVMVQSPL